VKQRQETKGAMSAAERIVDFFLLSREVRIVPLNGSEIASLPKPPTP
jgi:hypothetical protein